MEVIFTEEQIQKILQFLTLIPVAGDQHVTAMAMVYQTLKEGTVWGGE